MPSEAQKIAAAIERGLYGFGTVIVVNKLSTATVPAGSPWGKTTKSYAVGKNVTGFIQRGEDAELAGIRGDQEVADAVVQFTATALWNVFGTGGSLPDTAGTVHGLLDETAQLVFEGNTWRILSIRYATQVGNIPQVVLCRVKKL